LIIYHLCVGNYVFKSVGYTDPTYPNKYVYHIHGNLGDFYKTEGCSDILAKLIFNKDNSYNLNVYSDLFSLKDSLEVINLLVRNIDV
jgi:hypothetical protein